MNKLRWGKFYWSDWADDPALGQCSHTAQSVWMRLMCIAAQGTPYGTVTINGKPPSIKVLARHMRPPLPPYIMTRIIAELEEKGVAARDENHCLFARRMRADHERHAVRSLAGTKGAQARLNNGLVPGLPKQTGSNGPFLSKLESESKSQKTTKGSSDIFDPEDADERVVRFNGARARQRPPEDPMEALRRMCIPPRRHDGEDTA